MDYSEFLSIDVKTLNNDELVASLSLILQVLRSEHLEHQAAKGCAVFHPEQHRKVLEQKLVFFPVPLSPL